VDVDLSILGSPLVRYEEYERQIRAEYSHVPPKIFESKRAGILQGFLDRPRIFNTQVFFERYEQPARVNLARAIARLRAGGREAQG
jgi:predicted metal-dependent HD superfamily phosphohydrolase